MVDGKERCIMDADHIYAKINEARREMDKWVKELELLQQRCVHAYERERDDDYHSSSYVYICKKCHHFTRMKPEAYEIRR